MKKIAIMFVLMLACMSVSAPSPSNKLQNNTLAAFIASDENIKSIKADMPNVTIEKILTLTPKKYKEITGKKLGIKKAIQLKLAQKKIKKYFRKNNTSGDIGSAGYIILAILGLGFIGCGIATDWTGNDWIICLLLSLCCWLPGVIYALVKMPDYDLS